MTWRPYPEYKDSGIDWLGVIPGHWDLARLKRAFTMLNGSTPKSGEPSFWDGDIWWATPDDLGQLEGDTLSQTRRTITLEGYESCGTCIAPKGSLVLSTRAPIGHLAIAGVPLCTNQGCRCLVFRKNDNRRFHYYLLITAKQELESWGQGSTFKELSRDKLGSVILPSLPLAEQHSIASFLDRKTAKINALIAKKECLIELLKERRTALISHAVTKGLDPTVPMKDSGIDWLGEIPEHWEVVPPKRHTLRLQTGSTPPTGEDQYYSSEDVPWFGPGSFRDELELKELTRTAAVHRDEVARADRDAILELVEMLVQVYRPQKVILFGSHAYGEPDEDSDIDLLIVKNTEKRPIERWVEVKKLLRGSACGPAVSPLVYTEDEVADRIAMRDFFVEEILERGELLYG